MSVVAIEGRLKLSAKDPTEQRILDYLIENVSDVLAEKINAGKKTLAGALDYAKCEARKLAKGASSICVDDATVFGWIIHYFEEDSIKEGSKRTGSRVPGGVKKNPKPTAKAKPAKKDGPIVMELFSDEEMGVCS